MSQDMTHYKKPKKDKSVFPYINVLIFILFCLFILVPIWKVLVDSLDASAGYGMSLLPRRFSFDGYKTVYIGYPIWWGDAPRIMSTFVESHSFENLTVIPFCTSGSSGIGRSGSNLASQAKSGRWLDGRRFSGSVSEAELQSWIDGLR